MATQYLKFESYGFNVTVEPCKIDSTKYQFTIVDPMGIEADENRTGFFDPMSASFEAKYLLRQRNHN